MLLVGDVHEVTVPRAILHLHDEVVEHHLAQGVRGAEPPGDHAHGGVAVAGERGLHDGEVEDDRAEVELGQRLRCGVCVEHFI
jgi:hypothetical protein